jgi:hypothetical protein
MTKLTRSQVEAPLADAIIQLEKDSYGAKTSSTPIQARKRPPPAFMTLTSTVTAGTKDPSLAFRDGSFVGAG